uniref:Adenylate cyclase activating polypeptide 1a n=1 Tax=Sinocyclocheilus grahami TaxID=75366 RepID=A0A672P309_SINGR
MMSSSKTTLAFLIYGLLVQCNVLSYPNIRTAGFDEEGNSLTDLTFDTDQISLRSSPSVTEDAYTFYSIPKMGPNQCDSFGCIVLLAKTNRDIRLFKTFAHTKKMRFAKCMIEDDNEPLSKRHSDGVFTDSYSHYRKQMAVKKYLAAVLGKRYRQRYRSKGRRLAYL